MYSTEMLQVEKLDPRLADITFQMKQNTTVPTLTVSKMQNTESVQARIFLGLQNTEGTFL